MSLPANSFIYEFLYRGRPSGNPLASTFHVVIGVPGTDAFGNAAVAYSAPMTPDQAAAEGFDPAAIVAGLNTALSAQVTSLLEQITDLQAQLAAQPAAPQGTHLTFLQFQALFTSAEETAIMTAAQSTPALMLWLLKAAGAQFIDLSDPQTKAGLDALVAVGVLTADREAVILAGTPPS